MRKGTSGNFVKKAYIDLKEENHLVEANKIRSAFLLSKTLNGHSVEYSELLVYFAVEEAEDILNHTETHGEQSDSFKEISEEVANKEVKVFPEYTGLSAFIIGCLIKNKLIEKDVSYAEEISEEETVLFTREHFKPFLVKCFLNLHLGTSSFYQEEYFKYYIRTRTEKLKGFDKKILFENDTLAYEEYIDSVYEKIKESEPNKIDSLAKELVVLIIVNWFKGDLVTTKYYLMKFFNVVKKTDYLYNVVRFFEQEIVMKG